MSGAAIAPNIITAGSGFAGALLGYLASSQTERRRDATERDKRAEERAQAREGQEREREMVAFCHLP